MNAYTLWKELDSLTGSLLSTTVPVVDVTESKEHYELIAELPGFAKDQVSVQVKDGVLELVARREPTEGTDQAQWLLRERRPTNLQRTFRLPRDVDHERIDAAFRDGLLILTLPKKEEAKPRVVEIKAA